MASQPSDEDITQFMSFAYCHDKQLAVRFLQGANGDMGQAVNNYFDNPNRYSNVRHGGLDEYHEYLLTANRKRTMSEPSHKTATAATSSTTSQVGGRCQSKFTEELNKHGFAAFQIHAPDEPAQSYSHSSAPTRPPSRASHQGLAGSMEMQQESGVVGSSGPVFGPATREHYDMSKWALTHPGVTESEIFPDVDIPHRARIAGEPVIIKPLTPASDLPSLLTILNTIPMAQEMLLSVGDVAPDGSNWEEFFVDPSIRKSKTGLTEEEMDEMDSESMSEVETTDRVKNRFRKNLVRHVQRLVAFMIFTDRSYGDIEQIWELKNITEAANNVTDDRTPAVWFLEEWTDAIRAITGRQKAATLFEVIGVHGALEHQEEWRLYSFQVYDLKVTLTDDDEKPTLYDVLDASVWAPNSDGTQADDLWLHETPNVLILSIQQDDLQAQGLNMKVPSSFFMDRYTYEHVGLLRELRQIRTARLIEIEALRAKISRLTKLTNSDSSNKTQSTADKDSQLVLDEAIACLKRDQDLAGPEETELIQRFESLKASIERKVKELEQEIVEIKADIKAENNLLESANPPRGPKPTKLYTLRGVSTSIDVTFVLYPRADSPSEHEWWRLEYTSTPSLTKTQVSEAAVLHAARSTSPRATLVYATAAAACEPVPALASWDALTPPLRAAVADDNAALRADLRAYADPAAAWPDATVLESVEDDPPPYNPGAAHEDLQWAPDPGPDVVTDAEYVRDAKAWRERAGAAAENDEERMEE